MFSRNGPLYAENGSRPGMSHGTDTPSSISSPIGVPTSCEALYKEGER